MAMAWLAQQFYPLKAMLTSNKTSFSKKDHLENVKRMTEEPRFDFEGYEEHISHCFSSDRLDTLNQIEGSRKAYEINQDPKEIFQEVGPAENFGLGDFVRSDRRRFGPAQKTLSEFKSARGWFEREMVSTLRD